MSEKLTLSKDAFEYLVQHLVEIEASKSQVMTEYFQAPTKERAEFEALLGKYIKKMDALIKRSRATDEGDNNLPFVTVGSEVEVEDLDSRERYTFRIVNPSEVSIGSGDVSYLSPVGKSLLAGKTGSKVKVKVPAGTINYQILSIRLPVSRPKAKSVPN